MVAVIALVFLLAVVGGTVFVVVTVAKRSRARRERSTASDVHQVEGRTYGPGVLVEMRSDPAANAWRTSPHDYSPPFEVSTEPKCPYCSASLGQRKAPSRRSKFSCKSCGEVVWVDPSHRIFPSVYLDARHGLIARTLGALDRSWAAAGRTEDYWWTARQKGWQPGKPPPTDGFAADILWSLMNYCVANMQDILPKEESHSLTFHHDELQRLMAEYRQEEAQIKAGMKKTARAATSGASDPAADAACPYCGAALKSKARPSRRSKRKCARCAEQIIIDPAQKLFPTPYLTTKRASIADALAQLSHWVFTKGNAKDVRAILKEKGLGRDASDDEVAAAVRELIAANAAQLQGKPAPTASARCAQVMASVAVDKGIANLVDEHLSKFDADLRNARGND